MSATSSFYNTNAIKLAEQYDSLKFESVHQSWCAYWPGFGCSVLDVGAGSGRDVQWFSEHGCSVVAVEPSESLRQLGIQNTSSKISWLDDSLPSLNRVRRLSRRYDLILLSAVWMHLPESQRYTALKVLPGLLSAGGKLVITLRHGAFKDGRENFGVSVSELEELSGDAGLSICHVAGGEDSLKREDVMWQTVVLQKVSTVGSEG